MSLLRKIGKFVDDRLPAIAIIALIISVHWGWYRLQQNPALVPESEREEFPPLAAGKHFAKKIKDYMESRSRGNSKDECTQETK